MFFDTTPAARASAAATRPATYLAAKLAHHGSLTSEERAGIGALLARDVRGVAHRGVLVERGATPGEIHVLLAGWACRYAIDGAGRRRIVAFYIPGDVCDFDVFLMRAFDQSIAAIGPVRVAGINRATLNEVSRALPRVSHGLWWESMTAAAIQRAWTINAGHRSATRRIAHLICELYTRLALVGLADDGRCTMPLTQADIADACALTAIHTNRALQEVRAAGVLSFADHRLTIRDWDALVEIAGFDGSYLQVEQPDPVPLPPPLELTT